MGIEYNKEEMFMRKSKSSKPKGLIGLMSKKGWVKNKSEANAVLIIVIIILSITTFIIINRTSPSEDFVREPILQNLPIDIQNKLSPAVKDLIK